MKIAFYTDMHWSGTWPRRRKDDYTATVERKHRYIYQDAKERFCDLILNAGDINETPLLANSIINKQIEVMKTNSIQEYGIIGNHDVIGNNAEKSHQVSVSILFSAGFMGRLKRDEPVRFEKDGITVAIFGIDIHKDMDNLRPEDYYIEKPDWADYCILVAHGWLTDRPIDIDGLKHTTFADVVSTGTQADIIYTGHYHPGHGTVRRMRQDGKEIIFHNPGSPVRIKASKQEMERSVGYSITNIRKDGIDVNFIPFPENIALPAEEVIDRESLVEDIKRKEQRESILYKHSDISFKSFSPRGVIMEIAKENKISKDAKEDLIGRLDSVDEQLEKERLSFEI